MITLMDAAPPLIQFGGRSVAKSSCIGKLVRTRPYKIASKTLTDVATSAPVANARSLLFDGQEFVLVESFGTSYHSSDGVTWTLGGSVPTLGSGSGIGGATDGQGTIIINGNNTASTNNLVKTTNHGITWAATGTTPANTYYYPIAYGNGRWIAFRAGTTFTESIYSDDAGATWSNHGTLPNPAAPWRNISYVNGIWYATCDYWSNMAISIDNGSTWTTYSLTANSNGAHSYNKILGKFLVGAAGGVWKPSCSVNGRNWYEFGRGASIGPANQAVEDVFIMDRDGGGNAGALATDGGFNDWSITNWNTSWRVEFMAKGNGYYLMAGASSSTIVKFTSLISNYEGVTE